MNSSASNHMIQTTNILQKSYPFKGSDFVMIGNNNKLQITHIGYKNIERNSEVKDVFVMSKLKKNLNSISKLVINNPCSLKFIVKGCIVKGKKTRIIMVTRIKRDDLYTLKGDLYKALAASKAEKNSN